MKRILLVCLGNICRSPAAQGVLESKLHSAGLDSRVAVDSAGTAGWHTGKSPDARMISAAAERGYDLSALRASQVTLTDFEQYDLILAMDETNYADLLLLSPEGLEEKVQPFLTFAGMDVKEVPDPYYGDQAGFQQVLVLLENASNNIVAKIKDGYL